MARIARAIRSGRQMSLFPFPAELIELHEAELIQPDPVRLHAVEDHGKASARLEGVYPGARNESLFLVVRLWAYKQRRGSDLRAWCGRVKDFTLESNHRLPVPLGEREAASTAYSVATWIWSALNEIIPAKGKGPLDHVSDHRKTYFFGLSPTGHRSRQPRLWRGIGGNGSVQRLNRPQIEHRQRVGERRGAGELIVPPP